MERDLALVDEQLDVAFLDRLRGATGLGHRTFGHERLRLTGGCRHELADREPIRVRGYECDALAADLDEDAGEHRTCLIT